MLLKLWLKVDNSMYMFDLIDRQAVNGIRLSIAKVKPSNLTQEIFIILKNCVLDIIVIFKRFDF